MLRSINLYFLTNLVTTLVYIRVSLEGFTFCEIETGFYVSSRSYSEINSVYSNKLVLYQLRH